MKQKKIEIPSIKLLLNSRQQKIQILKKSIKFRHNIISSQPYLYQYKKRKLSLPNVINNKMKTQVQEKLFTQKEVKRKDTALFRYCNDKMRLKAKSKMNPLKTITPWKTYNNSIIQSDFRFQ